VVSNASVELDVPPAAIAGWMKAELSAALYVPEADAEATSNEIEPTSTPFVAVDVVVIPAPE
jgi:hypothetical protein